MAKKIVNSSDKLDQKILQLHLVGCENKPIYNSIRGMQGEIQENMEENNAMEKAGELNAEDPITQKT